MWDLIEENSKCICLRIGLVWVKHLAAYLYIIGAVVLRCVVCRVFGSLCFSFCVCYVLFCLFIIFVVVLFASKGIRSRGFIHLESVAKPSFRHATNQGTGNAATVPSTKTAPQGGCMLRCYHGRKPIEHIDTSSCTHLHANILTHLHALHPALCTHLHTPTYQNQHIHLSAAIYTHKPTSIPIH